MFNDNIGSCVFILKGYCNGTRTHNYLACKPTPGHIGKLASMAEWLSVRLRSGYGFEFRCFN